MDVNTALVDKTGAMDWQSFHLELLGLLKYCPIGLLGLSLLRLQEELIESNSGSGGLNAVSNSN